MIEILTEKDYIIQYINEIIGVYLTNKYKTLFNASTDITSLNAKKQASTSILTSYLQVDKQSRQLMIDIICDNLLIQWIPTFKTLTYEQTTEIIVKFKNIIQQQINV